MAAQIVFGIWTWQAKHPKTEFPRTKGFLIIYGRGYLTKMKNQMEQKESDTSNSITRIRLESASIRTSETV